MWWHFVFTILAATAVPRDEGCRALCVRDGFDDGKSLKRGCVCFQVKEDYEEFLRGRLILGEKKDTDAFIVIGVE